MPITKSLSIVNGYGNVDVREGLSKAYTHVRGTRLQPLCRKLGIRFAPAVVFFEETRYGYKPVYNGVVVSTRSAAKLQAAIAEREKRTNSPQAQTDHEMLRQRWKAEEQEHRDRCARLGVRLDGKLAEALRRGEVEEDLAELLAFKAKYRHGFTDYDKCFTDDESDELLYVGCSPREIAEERRALARMTCQGEPIPATWPEFLEKYGFGSPVAKALAAILQDPHRCHPPWFKEAEIAVRRAGLHLDGLTYEKIRDAIDVWRRHRGYSRTQE
jgi:hypothetical protein